MGSPSYFFYSRSNRHTYVYIEMEQTHTHTHNQDQHSSHQPQSIDGQDSSCNQESINQEQLSSMFTTLRKMKHVFKLGKLTTLKKERKSVNQAFRRMSLFFLPRKVHRKAQRREKGSTKQQRVKLREKRLATLVNQRGDKAKQPYCQVEDELRPELEEPPFLEDAFKYHNRGETSGMVIKCHLCKASYRAEEIHPFYGTLCPSCAQLNIAKRLQRADLSGKTALVTGGRIKIGFEIALRLLRDGATVIVSSRFPSDTVARYEAQEDYGHWKDRLRIVQCDFICQAQVQRLIEYVQAQVQKLDILINNAAQTIVRPKEFFSKELKRQQLAIQQKQSEGLMVVKYSEPNPCPSVFSNAIALRPGDIDTDKSDQFGQPVDRRRVNTWVQPIQDVSLLDCYTTQVVNSIVPFHLISRLKGKMMGSTPSWVINVSSMEGVFHRSYKSEHHPHTNMAKAALNMITRTCSQQFRQDGIFMNSVDTGWVTNENPLEVAERMRTKFGFKCPLDCVDGAMRVLDPVFEGVLNGQFPSGHFLKNYKVHPW